MNKFLIGTTCLVIGRYIGRKDDEGRGQSPGLLDFVAQMTPIPNPENTDFPYKLPSLLRWPKFLRPNPPTGSGDNISSAGLVSAVKNQQN